MIDEGNMRVDLGKEGGVRVTTIQGEAEVRANGQRVLLRARERTYIDSGSRGKTLEAVNEDYDELDDWNASRMNSCASATDNYGEEQPMWMKASITIQTISKIMVIGALTGLMEMYGYLMFPYGWRPYYDGRWTLSPGGLVLGLI